jgi:hypothetical protein
MTLVPGQSNVDRLKAWAEPLRLTVHLFDPPPFTTAKVGIFGPGTPSRTAIIERSSSEGYEQAASYLINALELLGAEIPR